ncbi:MAG: hypothetical protein EOO39_05790 [Cytophagaceae bacterium]|nr:MAG: hypothetical protein EOO39_05790 [Cytophagaceae bacterium]
MKTYWIASLALALSLTTAAFAQQPTQQSSSANAVPTPPRKTSSREGLDRKGGVDVGREGSPKMKDGVSRSGNSNLSPTSPTNVPPPGGDKPGAKAGTKAAGAPAAGGSTAAPTTATTPAKPKGTGTRNGNTGSAGTKPVQTQGSTSEGSASVPSSGGAPGTGTKTVRSVQPKSRAAMMDANAKQNQPSAAGQASSAKKTGANGASSPGSTNISITDRAQKEGSYSDASKRNKTPEGASKDPLKTGPNGQQTKPAKQ